MKVFVCRYVPRRHENLLAYSSFSVVLSDNDTRIVLV